MAGIGFELKKLMSDRHLLGRARAYGYAGVLSSGPWIIAILGILILGVIGHYSTYYALIIGQFQITVTYLIAFSLILSGFSQFGFTRYVADRIFEKKIEVVIPNYCAMLLINMLVSGLFISTIASVFFQQLDLLYRLTIISSFVVLDCIWLSSNLLSGMKAYRAVLFAFFLGYGSTVGFCFALFLAGLKGLMLGFLLGQSILLISLIYLIFRYYPSNKLIDFDCFKKGRMYLLLIFTGFFYNAGIWVDKIIFWYFPTTSQWMIGPLRASPIYDMPIFLSYLTLIPGMAVFLFKMETDFVACYQSYYNAIREGSSLREIEHQHYQMALAARQGIYEMAKVQGFMVFVMFIIGQQLLVWLGVSTFYAHLLNVTTVAAGLQVVFLGLLNINFYLDKKLQTFILTLFFMLCNIGLTLLSVFLGAFYYGYGIAFALLLADILGIIMLDVNFKNLEYTTFMLR